MNKLLVKDLISYFKYRQISGDGNSLLREIREPSVNRPGLELSGYLTAKVYKRVVILGEKEISYVATMSEERQKESFEYLTGEDIPMILIGRDLPCPKILLDIAKEKNFPIFTSFAPTYSLTMEIISYLEEILVNKEPLHGVLLQVYGRGVIIQGESGIGKSEIALELIKKGHLLVADDRVDVYRVHNKIYGEAPEILKNMIEIRGVGIIDATSMFGVASTTEKSQVDYAVMLSKWDPNAEYDRLGSENTDFLTIAGIDIPRITIPVSEGRSIATIIEAAITNFILRDKGINSADILENRITDFMNKQKGE